MPWLCRVCTDSGQEIQTAFWRRPLGSAACRRPPRTTAPPVCPAGGAAGPGQAAPDGGRVGLAGVARGGSADVRRVALMMEEKKALGPLYIRLCRSGTHMFET